MFSLPYTDSISSKDLADRLAPLASSTPEKPATRPDRRVSAPNSTSLSRSSSADQPTQTQPKSRSPRGEGGEGGGGGGGCECEWREGGVGEGHCVLVCCVCTSILFPVQEHIPLNGASMYTSLHTALNARCYTIEHPGQILPCLFT